MKPKKKILDYTVPEQVLSRGYKRQVLFDLIDRDLQAGHKPVIACYVEMRGYLNEENFIFREVGRPTKKDRRFFYEITGRINPYFVKKLGL